jgi:transposase-like protein
MASVLTPKLRARILAVPLLVSPGEVRPWTAQACKEAEIVEQTYFRWRKEYGGLQVDQAKRLKELEQEKAKLKRLVAELSLDKLVLKTSPRETSKP